MCLISNWRAGGSARKTRTLNVIFFFSSRRRHTRYWRDWSSDVCSSDLGGAWGFGGSVSRGCAGAARKMTIGRSEERRVGKSVDLGGRRIIKKKKHEKLVRCLSPCATVRSECLLLSSSELYA